MISALKSLTYFDDIDFSAKVDMTSTRFNWTLVKKRILDMSAYPHKIFDTPPLEEKQAGM